MTQESRFLTKKQKELEKKLELLESVESEEEYFKKKSQEWESYRRKQRKTHKNNTMDTVGVCGLYGKRDMRRYDSYNIPIFANTAAGPLKSLEHGRLLLSHEIRDDPNKIYSRFDNTTVDHLASKIAAMEGKEIPELAQGLCTASGMSAIFLATLPFLEAGENFVASKLVYGGTHQLFESTYPKMGWDVRWVRNPQNLRKWEEKINKNTKFLYVEFPTNPTLSCPNIPAIADVAHERNLPLIIDSTLATPILTRPLEHGADIVIHSTTKMMCGSGRTIGGAIISKEEIVTKQEDLKSNFVESLKEGHFRNIGACMSPYGAKEVWDSLNTLKIRMKATSEKAMKIAQFLQQHSQIKGVNYPGLPSHPQHETAKKLMELPSGNNAYGNLLSFQIRGGIEAAKKFAQKFDFGVMVGDLGSDYTVWVHPATTTHSQMSKEERKAAGIPDNLIRYSVGLEGVEDGIKALEKALDQL